MQFLIVTSEAAPWNAFVEALAAERIDCRFVDTTAAVLEAVKGDLKPTLVLWDEAHAGAALRAAAIEVMMIDARIHQTACSADDEDVFHEVTEGLGFLPQVPVTRSADDARALLAALRKVDPTL